MFRWLRACFAMVLVLALGLGAGRALCPTMARGEACATMACGLEAGDGATRWSCHPGDPTKFSQNAKLNPKPGGGGEVADREQAPSLPELPLAWWAPWRQALWPLGPPAVAAWAPGPSSPPPEA